MEKLYDIWPLIVTIVGCLAWIIRLEAKVLYLEKDLSQQKASHENRDASIWAKVDALQVTMVSILQSLAKIEGRLQSNVQE